MFSKTCRKCGSFQRHTDAGRCNGCGYQPRTREPGPDAIVESPPVCGAAVDERELDTIDYGGEG